jgi:hypothetical protein
LTSFNCLRLTFNFSLTNRLLAIEAALKLVLDTWWQKRLPSLAALYFDRLRFVIL